MNRPAPTRTAACTFPRTTYQTPRCRPSNCGWSAGKHHARRAGSQETRQPASLLRLCRRQFSDVLALRIAGAAEKFTKATATLRHGRTALLALLVGQHGLFFGRRRRRFVFQFVRQRFGIATFRIAGAGQEWSAAAVADQHRRTALLTFYVGHDGRRLFDDCDLTRGVT